MATALRREDLTGESLAVRSNRADWLLRERLFAFLDRRYGGTGFPAPRVFVAMAAEWYAVALGSDAADAATTVEEALQAVPFIGDATPGDLAGLTEAWAMLARVLSGEVRESLALRDCLGTAVELLDAARLAAESAGAARSAPAAGLAPIPGTTGNDVLGRVAFEVFATVTGNRATASFMWERSAATRTHYRACARVVHAFIAARDRALAGVDDAVYQLEKALGIMSPGTPADVEPAAGIVARMEGIERALGEERARRYVELSQARGEAAEYARRAAALESELRAAELRLVKADGVNEGLRARVAELERGGPIPVVVVEDSAPAGDA